jgi:hypothetical protein
VITDVNMIVQRGLRLPFVFEGSCKIGRGAWGKNYIISSLVERVPPGQNSPYLFPRVTLFICDLYFYLHKILVPLHNDCACFIYSPWNTMVIKTYLLNDFVLKKKKIVIFQFWCTAPVPIPFRYTFKHACAFPLCDGEIHTQTMESNEMK